VAKVEVSLSGGAWQSLPADSWGTWAASLHAPYGTTAQFRASDAAGDQALSAVYPWGPTSPPPFTASFSPVQATSPSGVQVNVSANQPVSSVEASVNGGAWQAMSLSSGTWSLGAATPYGSHAQFRATNGTGAQVLSSSYAWGPTSPPPFTASFAPVAQSNDWWVEVAVSANQSVAKVEASLNGGAWQSLPRQSWGNYAASLHAPYPTKVQFRATNGTGATALSAAFTWGQQPFTASFTPKAVGNDWWVEVAVGANQTLAKVEASLNGGAWQNLPADSWGTWGASLHAPNGTKVQFRATAQSGQTAVSAVTKW
jgi:hypothetical protein